MQKTSGLGRGLDSLIPNKKNKITARASVQADEDSLDLPKELDIRENIINIPIDKISPNPHQPRQDFAEAGLKELVESIKEHGIIQPLIVTKVDSGWQLIAGERRWRSAKIAGLKTVPGIVRDLNEQKKLEMALIENLQRTDLNVLETASAYQKLIDEFNLSQEDLGKRVGKNRSTIANTLRILTAAEKVKEAIRKNQISESHARVLVGLPLEDQLVMLQKIINNNLNVRETEKAGREVVVKKHIRKVSFDPELKAKEEELQRALGTKVEIKKFGPSGQIVIKFFSDEELKGILDKIL